MRKTGERNSNLTERGKPLKKRYRDFGLMLASLCLIAGLAPLLKSSGPRPWALATSVAVYFAAFFAPGLLSVPYRFMLKAGHVLGIINTRILLGLFFFVILVPVAFAKRLTGGRLIDDSFKTGRISYWDKKQKPSEPASYERIF